MDNLYRKKPVVIEAYQVPEFSQQSFSENAAFFNWLGMSDRGINYNADGTVTIETLEGAMTASKGDWVIKGVNGEYYPCKPDIFEKTYEKA